MFVDRFNNDLLLHKDLCQSRMFPLCKQEGKDTRVLSAHAGRQAEAAHVGWTGNVLALWNYIYTCTHIVMVSLSLTSRRNSISNE